MVKGGGSKECVLELVDPCFFNVGHMGSHCNGSSDYLMARQQHDNGCSLALSYLSCIIMTLPDALSSFIIFITI